MVEHVAVDFDVAAGKPAVDKVVDMVDDMVSGRQRQPDRKA